MCGFWGLLRGAGLDQPLTVFFPEPASISYKVISGKLPLVLGLEVPRPGQTENQAWGHIARRM